MIHFQESSKNKSKLKVNIKGYVNNIDNDFRHIENKTSYSHNCLINRNMQYLTESESLVPYIVDTLFLS